MWMVSPLTHPKVDLWVSQFSSLCSSSVTLVRKKKERKEIETETETKRDREIGYWVWEEGIALENSQGRKIYH